MGNTKHLTAEHATWLADTIARNRARFGGWRMEADPAPTPDPAPAPEPSPTPTPEPDDGKGGKDAVLADLAKERDKRQAAEKAASDLQAAHQQQMDALATALGLKKDEPADPAKLAEQIAAEQGKTAEAEARATDAERKLAVFLAAPAHDANAVALLDSTTFLGAIKDVDHTDAEKLGAAIKAAVEKDARFKASPPTPPFPGGPRKPAGSPDPGPGLPRLRDAYAQSSK